MPVSACDFAVVAVRFSTFKGRGDGGGGGGMEVGGE